MKIYICIYHIYNIYIKFQHYGTVLSFFFLQINVYSVSASKYKQFFHSANYGGSVSIPVAIVIATVRSTHLKDV